MLKISVIIPTYNRATYITKAIDSVLNQTFKDYEIILIDDGSTDATDGVLKKYKSKIQYIFQKNSGVSAARNTGIKIAKGEWLAFLDSDDEWLPTYLESQMEAVALNPQLCMLITNYYEIDLLGKKTNNFAKKNLLHESDRKKYIIIDKPLKYVLRHHITALDTAVIHRESFLKAGYFNEALHIAEDIDLIARVSLQGPMGVCQQPLAFVYRRDELTKNLTNQYYINKIDTLKCLDNVCENLLSNVTLNISEVFFIKQIRSSNQRWVGNLLLQNREKKQARIYFRDAFQMYPSVISLLKYLLTFFPIKMSLLFIKK